MESGVIFEFFMRQEHGGRRSRCKAPRAPKPVILRPAKAGGAQIFKEDLQDQRRFRCRRLWGANSCKKGLRLLFEELLYPGLLK